MNMTDMKNTNNKLCSNKIWKVKIKNYPLITRPAYMQIKGVKSFLKKEVNRQKNLRVKKPPKTLTC